MVGIVSWSVYLPYYFLTGEALGVAWNQPPGKLAKRIANFDEDSLTMAIQAALGLESAQTDAVFFASTTSPYREKMCSSIIAAVLGAANQTKTADFANSLRSATAGLFSARDSVVSGSVSSAIVTAADCRLAEPGSPEEITLGDGSAAIILGKENIAAEILSSHSITSELLHIWRRSSDSYIRTADARFSEQFGYVDSITSCVSSLLKKAGVSAKDISKAIIPLPEIRPIRAICEKLGLDMKSQWFDPLSGFTGFTGAAHPFILLASALENSKPGEKILLISYGDGCDAILLATTENVVKLGEAQKVKKALSCRKEIASYAKFLDYRNILARWDWTPGAFASTIMEHRQSEEFLGLQALKCRKCGLVLSLSLPVCPSCRAEKEFDKVKLSRSGRIFTYTQEHYYPTPEPPVTMAVVDLDGGGRILVQMTDSDYRDVKIGLEVELVFRKMHEAGNFHNYYWKAVPV
jgi:3-hydroxy-3-methylglutaryl CoA synthase